ncbi:hypothetical protein evm_005190 [Chilo suppressalis]|nr:hypothetical protein evm_005190 [Chilo suppressalis]
MVLSLRKAHYGNFKRHIRRRHPHIYVKEKLGLTSSTVDKISNKEEIYILEYIEDEKLLDEVDYITTSNDKHEPQNVSEKDSDSEDEYSSDKNNSHDFNTEAKDDQESVAVLVSKMTPSKWGWVKKFMRNIDERRKQCLLCSSVLQLPPGTYGNMTRHIRSKHRSVFMKEYMANMPKKSQGENSDNAESQQEKFNTPESAITLIEQHSKGGEKSKKLSDSQSENEKGLDCDDIQENIEITTNPDVNILPKSGIAMRSGWVKDYCEKIDFEKWQCSICSTVIKMRPGIYGNMKRHIRAKHEHIYKKELLHCISELENAKSTNDSNLQWERKYCESIGEKKCKCLICSAVLRLSNGWYNFKRHIKLRHPNIYKKEQTLSDIDNKSNKEEIYILEYIEDEKLLHEIDYLTTSDDKHEPLTVRETDSKDIDNTNKNSEDLNTGTRDFNDSIAVLITKRTVNRWGWVKEYMKNIDERSKQCLLCSKIVKCSPGSYSNMTRHIKNKHSTIFMKGCTANMSGQTNQKERSDEMVSLEENLDVSESSGTSKEEEIKDGDKTNYFSDSRDENEESTDYEDIQENNEITIRTNIDTQPN